MNLPDIISRARSVIEEAEGADEHAELLAELTAAEAHATRLIDFAQMASMGNTDADDLASSASAVLEGREAPDSDEDDEDGLPCCAQCDAPFSPEESGYERVCSDECAAKDDAITEDQTS